MRHFKKLLVSQPVKCLGALVSFEPVGGNVGVRKLDDAQEAPLIAELDRLADHRRGGVVKISAEVYEGLKKNPLPPAQLRNRTGVLSSLRVFNPESTVPKLRPSPKSAVAPAVAASSVAEPAVRILLPPPASNQRPSHAPGFTLSKQKRSEVEAKARAVTNP